MRIRFQFLLFIFIWVFQHSAYSQSQPDFKAKDSFLFKLLKSDDSLLNEVLLNQSKYQFQLMYTRVVNKETDGKLEQYCLNDNHYYFNPASLIKLPLLIIALEKMTSLKEYGVSLDTRISIHTCSCDLDTDGYVAKSNNPTFRQFIRELIIMSDNDAYNLLVDFVGYDYFNKRYRALGFDGILLKRRFTSNCNEAQNKWFGGLSFISEKNEILYQQQCDTAIETYVADTSKYLLKAGASHLENGVVVNGPKDFSNNNYLSFIQINQLFQELFYTNDFENKFKINKEYKNELLLALKDYPRNLMNSNYEVSSTSDWYYKFFVDTTLMDTKDTGLKIYNKVGMAGGFISDLSYVVDETNDIAYFISATMLAKKDDVINNGKNNYYDFGIPVFRKLGELVYRYEMNQRKVKSATE